MSNDSAVTKRSVVGIGAVCAASGCAEMIAYAIGSCIALCLYDPSTGVGAMTHVLLPSGSYTGHENGSIGVDTKYADHALSAALKRMRELGADARHVEAAIIGGARMFPHGNAQVLHIGEMNVASVTMELEKSKIPLRFSITGGEKSRTVSFRIPGESLEKQILVRSPRL